MSLIFLAFPNTTAQTIALGFGVYAVWDGVFGFIHASRNPPPSGGRWTTMIVAASSEIGIGLVALLLMSATAATIGTYIGASGIIAGSLGAVARYRGPGVRRENALAIAGGFTALVGFVLLFVPMAVVVAQIWTVAAYGVLLGFGFVLYALHLRRGAIHTP